MPSHCLLQVLLQHPETILPLNLHVMNLNHQHLHVATHLLVRQLLLSISFKNRQHNSSKPTTKSANKRLKQLTCRLKFVCLSSTTATGPPSSVKEKTDLCNAGLGDDTPILDLNEDSFYCHEKVLARYPRLNQSGGYELLLFQRGGGEGLDHIRVNIIVLM